MRLSSGMTISVIWRSVPDERMRLRRFRLHPELIATTADWEVARYQIHRFRAFCKPKRGCRNCGRRKVGPYCYCSVACQHEYEVNHFWFDARAEAIRRASVCDVPHCSRCGEPCSDETLNSSAEVHHRKQMLGTRAFVSCLHHQDNLEVMCHVCHRLRLTVHKWT